jgi:hypothetical protein
MQVTQHRTGKISVSVAGVSVGSQCGSYFMSSLWRPDFPKMCVPLQHDFTTREAALYGDGQGQSGQVSTVQARVSRPA